MSILLIFYMKPFYNRTIVTCDLDIVEWTDTFPNERLGSATVVRLRHGTYNSFSK